MGLLREAMQDDSTGKGSSTRIALLWAAAVLGLGLAFALRQYNLTGREGWVSIVNTLCVCLSTVLVGYASKLISSALSSKPTPATPPEKDAP